MPILIILTFPQSPYQNLIVEALTPDKQQQTYIARTQPDLTVHHMPFEAFKATQKWDHH